MYSSPPFCHTNCPKYLQDRIGQETINKEGNKNNGKHDFGFTIDKARKVHPNQVIKRG